MSLAQLVENYPWALELLIGDQPMKVSRIDTGQCVELPLPLTPAPTAWWINEFCHGAGLEFRTSESSVRRWRKAFAEEARHGIWRTVDYDLSKYPILYPHPEIDAMCERILGPLDPIFTLAQAPVSSWYAGYRGIPAAIESEVRPGIAKSPGPRREGLGLDAERTTGAAQSIDSDGKRARVL
jgi:hypothetical protein